MKLTENMPRTFELGYYNDLPMVADTKIFEGAAVSVNQKGNAQSLVAGEDFVGIAENIADNTGKFVGATLVRVKHEGKFKLKVNGATQANINDAVYASDDNTFSLNATGNSLIGYIRSIENENAFVELEVKRG